MSDKKIANVDWSMDFKKGDMKSNLLEESQFKVIFPKYRENYIKTVWPLLEKVFDEHGIKAELDLIQGLMTVATTRKTWDPFIILKARDIIKLLGRSVPVEQALKVLRDGVTYEIIKIKNLVRNRERFIKRRQRLIGANGTALKALELLTDCYVLVQGCTVSAIGPYKGVQQVVRVVLDTMKNIHPVHLLKTLMIKRELAKDPEKKNEDWNRFIPKYQSSNVKRKKPKRSVRKPYTPFPPERPERKQDKEMESGKFFIDKEDRERAQKRAKIKKRVMNTKQNQKEKRSHQFQKPTEKEFNSQDFKPESSSEKVDLNKLKRKIKKSS